MKIKIAYFISPHGFGHAARSAAVMEALNEINDNIEFHLFTLVPRWFFKNSKIFNFKYNELITDIGLVQKTPLEEDIYKTIDKLNEFYPLQQNLVDRISQILKNSRIDLVICDISPLGLVVAEKAGISSVLVENFTWDWIYDNYDLNNKKLNDHIEYLANIYNNAHCRIRTKPVCFDIESDLIVNPVSRKPKLPREEVRHSLNIPTSNSVVMITMGGITTKNIYMEKLYQFDNINFIIPGAADNFTKIKNLILLPHDSNFYHPDLINASDAVVGKLGYSTLAEVYNAGKVFCYITRDRFPESIPFEKYIKDNMTGIKVTTHEFKNHSWINMIDELLSIKVTSHRNTNGADEAASFINKLIV